MFAELRVVCTGGSSAHKPSYLLLTISYVCRQCDISQRVGIFMQAEYLNKLLTTLEIFVNWLVRHVLVVQNSIDTIDTFWHR